MNNKLKDDYYRMTGTKFSIVSGIVNIICRHNTVRNIMCTIYP